MTEILKDLSTTTARAPCNLLFPTQGVGLLLQHSVHVCEVDRILDHAALPGPLRGAAAVGHLRCLRKQVHGGLLRGLCHIVKSVDGGV